MTGSDGLVGSGKGLLEDWLARPPYAFLLVSGYFVVATIAFTWPAVLSLHTSVVGQLGDNLHFAWLIAWFDKALFALKQSPLIAHQLNYPEGWHLARSEITLAQVLQGVPLTRLGGPVFAFNMVALTSFVLSGLAAYYCTLALCGRRLPALVAGTAFAFSPFRIAHWRVGHLNMLGTAWFPIYLVAIAAVLRGDGRVRRANLIAGLALGLISLTSQYYLYLTLIASVLTGAAYLLLMRRKRLTSRALWGSLARIALIAAPFAAISLYPYAELARQDRYPSRELYDVSSGSASVSDFILPSTDHFMWGRWVGENFKRDHWPEATLYLGASSGAMAATAVIAGWKRNRAIRFIALFGVVGALLALGVHLYWNERLVIVQVPNPISDLLDREQTRIPMLGYVLFKVLPFFSTLRTYKRAGALVLTAVAVLAGLGAAELLKPLRGTQRRLAGLALVAAVWIDFYPGPFEQFSPVHARPVDHWLAEQPGEGAVADFPFELVEDQYHVFSSLTHGKPYLGGFFNAFPPPQYRRIRHVMEGFPDRDSVAILKELGVRYVLVEQGKYESFVRTDRAIRQLGLTDIGEMDGIAVYELLASDFGRVSSKFGRPAKAALQLDPLDVKAQGDG